MPDEWHGKDDDERISDDVWDTVSIEELIQVDIAGVKEGRILESLPGSVNGHALEDSDEELG